MSEDAPEIEEVQAVTDRTLDILEEMALHVGHLTNALDELRVVVEDLNGRVEALERPGDPMNIEAR